MSTDMQGPESQRPVAATGRFTLSALAGPVGQELQSLQSSWWLFLALGIALMVLGFVALGSPFLFTLMSVVMFGFLLVAAGIVQLISSFWAGKWSGFLLQLLIGIMYVVTGYITVHNPLKADLGITLVIALLLLAVGTFRIVAAMTMRFDGWPWGLLNGIVSLLLGLLIFRQWPEAGAWVIGTFVGIEMIFNGWSWVMLSLGLKSLPKSIAA